MPTKKFFAERTDQSEVKARIVEKYFYAWANVIMPSASLAGGKIAYIDLYAGPGRYEDGAASTPLLVLERAIAHPKMSQMLVAFLNDADKNLSDTLQNEINKLPGVGDLKFRPEVQMTPSQYSPHESGTTEKSSRFLLSHYTKVIRLPCKKILNSMAARKPREYSMANIAESTVVQYNRLFNAHNFL